MALRYASLDDIYRKWPALATRGPSDEQIRRELETAEHVVEKQLEQHGFAVPVEDANGKKVVAHLAALYALSVLTTGVGEIRYGQSVADYFRARYEQEFQRVLLNPLLLGPSPKAHNTHLPYVGTDQRQSASGRSLLERVRRWLW